VVTPAHAGCALHLRGAGGPTRTSRGGVRRR
jgi:hypothetical protein